MAQPATQIDLFAWAEELERDQARIAKANRARSERRGFLVFATDPEAVPDSPDYRRVYATVIRGVGHGLGIGGEDQEAAPFGTSAICLGDARLVAFQLLSPSK